MNRTIGLASFSALLLFQAPLAPGQPPPAQRQPQPAPAARPATNQSSETNPNSPANPQRYLRRSIVHHYPYPYPGYYHNDDTAGFRNPGSQGRFLEYYPPGDRFQQNNDPVKVAQFDTGWGNRQEQLQSLQIGVQRDNAIMGQIESFAMPRVGVGFFGGFY